MKFRFIIMFLLMASGVFAQDVYSGDFLVNGAKYRFVLLVYAQQQSKMRVMFHSEACNCFQIIEELADVSFTEDGQVKVSAHDAIYPGTETPYPNYTGDNFYMIKDKYGSWTAVYTRFFTPFRMTKEAPPLLGRGRVGVHGQTLVFLFCN